MGWGEGESVGGLVLGFEVLRRVEGVKMGEGREEGVDGQLLWPLSFRRLGRPAGCRSCRLRRGRHGGRRRRTCWVVVGGEVCLSFGFYSKGMDLEIDRRSIQVDIDSMVLMPSHTLIARDPQTLISRVLHLCNVIASFFTDPRKIDV